MAAVIRGARQAPYPVLLRHGPSAEPGTDEGQTASLQPSHESALPAASQEEALDAALRLLESQREQAIAEGFEEGRRRGHDSGYLNGHEEGLRQGRAEGETVLAAAREQMRVEQGKRVARWDALLAAVEQQMKAAIDGTEDMLVEIAFEALCKLLGEAMTQRSGVRAAVLNVVQRARAREMLVVRVAPDDLHLLQSEAAALGAPGVQVLGDARVRLGGCLLETSGGNLDGRLETQLQQLCDALLRARAMRQEEKT